jgi:iron-sulfur cluster insertion protein|tara:strand:- start:127 stop:480 length:354 start_codon:yes stop_codon:yes gene_type:complete
MSAPEVFNPQAFTVTDSAVVKVRELIDEEANEDLKLRVFVTGGGCSGFQYGFTFDELTAEDDAVINRMGVTVLVDSMSYPYLAGAQVDYEEGLQGSKFSVSNPNASSTCGCGSSFSV